MDIDIKTRRALDTLPAEILLLIFGELGFEDHYSLSTTSIRLHQFTLQHLYRDPVFCSGERGLVTVRDYNPSNLRFARTLELFPWRPADHSGKIWVRFFDFTGIHPSDVGTSEFAVKLLRAHPYITELAVNFTKYFFALPDSKPVLQNLKNIQKLSFSITRVALEDEDRSLDNENGDIDAIWEFAASNYATLRSLCFAHYGPPDPEDDRNTQNPCPEDILIVPPHIKWSGRRLQLHELKIKSVPRFTEVFLSTRFFNPQTLRTLSFAWTPNIDGMLQNMAKELVNLKSLQLIESVQLYIDTLSPLLGQLPPLDILHLGVVAADNDRLSRWPEFQKKSIRVLWLDSLLSNGRPKLHVFDFTEWQNLEELAVYSTLRSLRQLKPSPRLKILRGFRNHMTRDSLQRRPQEYYSKTFEALGNRQARIRAATTKAGEESLSCTPQLEVLVDGHLWYGGNMDGVDKPEIYRATYTPGKRKGKFDASAQQISTKEFFKLYPNNCMFGEARGPWAWVGRPFPEDRNMGYFDLFV
ncbi:hypothetical protein Dda_8693 [Drechslerella dactyloides]|uniref:F-box domain-containing protein n=1 Tax=Drechslerella dactyloides TaxID=74499 RepID=A0AAD6NFV9_DREDA|nr:hypothetical protein Dda_8693 [Drechslerella dactyloides]